MLYILLSHIGCVYVTQNGDSALTLAALHGHTDVIVDLVKAGANLNLQNKVLYPVEQDYIIIDSKFQLMLYQLFQHYLFCVQLNNKF